MGEVRRHGVSLMLFIGVVVAAGCGAHVPTLARFGPAPTPCVLFDAYPGLPNATEIAYQSNWPAVDSLYQQGEAVYFRERVMDLQYGGPGGQGNFGYTYRRFDTYREGSAVR
jgi:hypothetical protein